MDKRERPLVTGKDAERFVERCKLNEKKLKERNEKLKKSWESKQKEEETSEAFLDIEFSPA